MEKLNELYLELLSWLEYDGKPSESIWHPLFYRYSWGLRFELGEYAQDDEDAYVRSAYDRGQRIFDTVFAPEDEVLLIFDGTPDRELKEAMKGLGRRRVRAKWLPPFPDEEWDGDYFYRYLYFGPAGDFPIPALLNRAFSWKYGLYFYNRTKKLLFHPYDERGADLIGPDADALRHFYDILHDLLLDWDREAMARKFRPTRKVFLRILTTTTAPETEAKIREELTPKLRGTEPEFGPFTPYWKFEGWGEMNVTLTSAQPLEDIQSRLAGCWESDTASTQIHLPDVGFLWVGE